MRSILALLLLVPTFVRADPARRDIHGDPLPDGVIQRLGTARMKHPGASRISVAPDGKTVVTLGGDRHVRIWSAQTGKLLKALPYPPGRRNSDRPNFSEDGLRYVNIDKQVVQVWDMETLTITHRLPLKGVDQLTAVAFSPDPNVIATAEDTPREFRIRVWDLKKGTNEEVGHTETMPLQLVFVTPTRLVLALPADALGESRTLELWDLKDANRNQLLPGWPNSALQTGNPWLTMWRTTEKEREIDFWNLETLEKVNTVTDSFTRFRIAPDGGRMVVDAESGCTIRNRIDAGQVVALRRSKQQVFSLDSKFIYGFDSGSLQGRNDAVSGRVLWENPEPLVQSLAYDLKWLPDSQSVLVSRYQTANRHGIYDTRSGLLRGAWDGLNIYTFEPSVGFSKKPKIFSVFNDLEERTWSDELLSQPTVVSIAAFPQPGKLSRSLGLSPDGERLRLMQTDKLNVGSTFAEFDLTTKVLLCERNYSDMDIQWTGYNYSGFSRDARLFQYGPRLFFPDTGESTPARDGQAEVHGMTLSDRTDLLAAAHARPILTSPERPGTDPRFAFDLRVWDRFTGQTLVEFKDTYTVRRAFHPSGRFLATDHPDGIRIWNLLAGKLERLLPCHDPTYNDAHFGNYAYCLAFSPDGTKLATGHGDTTVLIWDVSDLPILPRERLDTATIETLWQQLREPDAKRANAAHWKLAGSPETVLPFLKDHLRPVRKVERQEVKLLLDQLEVNDFRKREAAAKKLDDLPDGFTPLLKELLDGDLSEDLRKRLAPLPEKRRWNVPPTGDDLRIMRAVRLLEAIGGTDALPLVEKLAEGVPTARATQEAIAARERMRHWR